MEVGSSEHRAQSIENRRNQRGRRFRFDDVIFALSGRLLGKAAASLSICFKTLSGLNLNEKDLSISLRASYEYKICGVKVFEVH